MALPLVKAPEWKREMIRYLELSRRLLVLKNSGGVARTGELADFANRILEFAAHHAATSPDDSLYRRTLCLWLFDFIASDPELEEAFLDGIEAIGDRDLNQLCAGVRQLIAARTRPMDIVLETVNAGTVHLGQKRNEVLLVDIWNLHCSGCIDALPEINRFAQIYRRDGLQVISVCLLEKGDDPGKVTKLMAKVGANGPLVIQPRTESPLNKQFSSFVFPTFMLIDRDGRLISIQNDKANLEELIKKALGHPGDAALNEAANK